jgi:hypothetical protein
MRKRVVSAIVLLGVRDETLKILKESTLAKIMKREKALGKK